MPFLEVFGVVSIKSFARVMGVPFGSAKADTNPKSG